MTSDKLQELDEIRQLAFTDYRKAQDDCFKGLISIAALTVAQENWQAAHENLRLALVAKMNPTKVSDAEKKD